MKNICIISQYEQGVVEAIKSKITGANIEVSTNFNDMEEFLEGKSFDLVVLVEYTNKISDKLLPKFNFINIHPSLLPAFPSETAIQDAYIAGVKVTGVTVYKPEPGKNRILAQYPIIIDNYTNYNQLIEEIEILETKLYPLVIQSVLEDKVFDIVELLSGTDQHSCAHGCGGCGGCLKS